MGIRADFPAVTRNPWHPNYELTENGRHRVLCEIAPQLVPELKAMFPNTTVAVVFGGIPYAGFVPFEESA